VQDSVMTRKSFDIKISHMLKERGLSDSVSTDKAIATTMHQPQRCILQQDPSSKSDVKI
jgi:hypothetical protein